MKNLRNQLKKLTALLLLVAVLLHTPSVSKNDSNSISKENYGISTLCDGFIRDYNEF